MTVTPINSMQEFNTAINSGKPVIIDFWATWCGPCRFVSPIFEKYSDMEDFNGVEFYKVDVDAVPDVAQEVGIKAMPTFAVFKDGKKTDELMGANQSGLQNILMQAKSLR